MAGVGILIGLSGLNLVLLAGVGFLLHRLIRSVKRARRRDKAQARKLRAALTGVRDRLQKSDDNARRRFDRSIWPQTESLIGLYRMLDGKAEFPSTRRWACSPDFLLHIAKHIRRNVPRIIVECGSGTSTVVMAHMLKAFKQAGHLYSIENHRPSVDLVQEQLRRHGLERFVTLIQAPLVERRYEGFESPFQWYGFEPDAVPDGIDLLIVDGPFGLLNEYARYPAGPELLPKLSRRAHVFVDDADRPQEMAMVRRWREIYPDLGIRKLDAEKGCFELFFLDHTIEAFLPVDWKAAEEAGQPPGKVDVT